MTLDFGLKGNSFALLPLGAVRAESWLENQLIMMKNGITGEMEKYPDYIQSEWLGVTGENWERGPYYLRGLVALAYVLDDKELKDKASRWIEAILSSQRENGMFGPTSNEDWWSRMPVLMALRDYYDVTEAAGAPDKRIIDFMIRYFKYEEKTLPELRLASWARARGGDNIDSVYWLYSKLHDSAHPEETDWLLELAKILHDQTQDWSYIMNETTVREHVVNTSQALKMPVLYSMQSGSEYDRNAFENALFNISIDHGRTDGLPSSDEAPRDNRSTRGSELCGIVEGMLSTEIAMRILKEGWIGDRLESLAYNALPCGYSYDYLGHVYYILQNQVMATNGYHEFDCDHGDSSAFGAPCGFDCCFSNNHMGWPKFVQSMWMAKPGSGIALAAYGPSSVRWGDISFEEITDYPFSDSIKLIYTGKEKEFELSLRIPEWCQNPGVSVAGTVYTALPGSFLDINRLWKKGDECLISFPMSIRTSGGYNGSAAVTMGPLIYSLPVKENWVGLSDNNARELKVPTAGKLVNHEVRPASPWNFALFTDSLEFEGFRKTGDHPFTPEGAPASIKAKAVRVPAWRLDGNIAGVQPCLSNKLGSAKTEEIRLVPYGCTRLKITHFPRANGREYIFTSPEKKTRKGETFYEFSFVTVPKAQSYEIVIRGAGSGRAVINGIKTFDIDMKNGDHVISIDADSSARGFHYTHYNNVRVYGAEACSIEVRPMNMTKQLVLRELSVRSHAVKLQVNADRSFCGFEVLVGTEPGKYFLTACGFKGNSAVINSLESEKEYFIKVKAHIEGEEVFSEEISVKTLKEDPEKSASFTPALLEISHETAFESAIFTFDRVEGAEYYEIDYQTEGEEYVRRVTDIIFNPYKGSGCFTKDKTSLTLADMSKKYTCVMSAYKENTCIARSKLLSVDF